MHAQRIGATAEGEGLGVNERGKRMTRIFFVYLRRKKNRQTKCTREEQEILLVEDGERILFICACLLLHLFTRLNVPLRFVVLEQQLLVFIVDKGRVIT